MQQVHLRIMVGSFMDVITKQGQTLGMVVMDFRLDKVV